MKQSLLIWSAFALLFTATACTKSSPARPSDLASNATGGAITDASTGITITTPVQVSPTVNQQFKFSDQPLTLTVKNAAQTGSGALTYGFDVATDVAFTNKVFSKDGIAEGSGGQTSLKIDTLAGPGAKNYFWRARASSPTVAGLYTAGRAFAVGPQVVIGAPALVSPNAGASLGDNGSLVVNNAGVTGPAGTPVYRFEVSNTAAFTNLAFAASATQGSGQTAAAMTAKLTLNNTYFWRAQVSDPSTGVVGPYSATGTFKYVPFDWNQAVIISSPQDLAHWGETAKITSVEFTGGGGPFLVDFDKRDSPDRWIDTPFGDGSLQYTLGMCVDINNTWYCSAVVQFWYGRELSASGDANNIGGSWFYDPARWRPPLAGYQPSIGETVGIFVCAGNCRNNDAGDRSYIKERSNLAFVQWGNDARF